MMSNAGRVLHHNHVIDHALRKSEGKDSGNIAVHLHSLRKKSGDPRLDPSKQPTRHFRTKAGVGVVYMK